MRGRALFEKVVEMCGVSGVLGPGLVRRALQEGDAAPEDAGPEDYEEALPQLRTRLATYLPSDEADRRIRRIAAILAGARGGSTRGAEERRGDLGEVVEILRRPRSEGEARSPSRPEREELFDTGERVKEGVELPPRRETGDGEP